MPDVPNVSSIYISSLVVPYGFNILCPYCNDWPKKVPEEYVLD
jgi:protein-disulfide isomerase